MLFFDNLNKLIYYHLNKFVLTYHLESFIRLFCDLPIFFLPLFLVFCWLYYSYKKDNKGKENLLLIFYSVLVSFLINILIQQLVYEKRPESYIKPILHHIPDNSFPSDHATVSFSFLVALYLFGYKKIFWIFLPFVLIMNFSRIAGGIHWFFDVVVGFIIGLITGLLIWKNKDNIFIKKINNVLIKLASFFKL